MILKGAHSCNKDYQTNRDCSLFSKEYRQSKVKCKRRRRWELQRTIAFWKFVLCCWSFSEHWSLYMPRKGTSLCSRPIRLDHNSRTWLAKRREWCARWRACNDASIGWLSMYFVGNEPILKLLAHDLLSVWHRSHVGNNISFRLKHPYRW